MKEALKYLKSKLKKDDKVIVACSGGSDSMGLLHLIMSNFKYITIICAHVNHKVRKKSDKEYKYVESFCKKYNLIFEGTAISFPVIGNFEAEARKFRYDFFEQLAKKYNAKYIITAHHGDDQIETVLMRITRGSNLSGYAGIKLEDGHLLRPLLKVEKKAILEYVKSNKIKYYDDATNKKNVHTRNRYRHIVTPFLKKENNKVHLKYLKFSNELQEYDKFVNDYIINNRLIINNSLSIDKILKESEFIQKKTIELLIKNIQIYDILEVTEKNVENMLNIIKSSKSNSKINLSNGYVAKRSYDHFMITKIQQNNEVYKEYNNDKFQNDNWIIKTVSHSDEKSNYLIRLDSQEIKMPLIIRSRKKGDYINLKNSGKKKIKDIFIDEKIDLDERSNYLIVTDSNDKVLWIPGVKKSEFDKDKSEKYDIILHSERKRKNEQCKKN